MPGTLYIVGTPIGNLEDVTMRALRVLREVDLIAAEDTRRTARLLQHYSIATPATSLHEHNEHAKAQSLILKLQEGASIALVSDAGMPLISDPGAHLVRAARAAGIPIQVVPGPSAVTAALAGAGQAGPFTFLGFPPASGTARHRWFATLGLLTAEGAVVFFEAPHRIEKTMAELLILLGDRPIMVAREVTKLHESLVEQPISVWMKSESSTKGEHVIVVPPGLRASEQNSELTARPSDEALRLEFGQLTDNEGLKPRAAARKLAQKYNLATSLVYGLCAID